MKKTCTACGVEKDAADFTARTGGRGVRSECKPCRAQIVRSKRQAQPERHILTLMVQRCHNENHPRYEIYGGRGIAVCDEWRATDGFALFLAHIGTRPTPRHSVDRIDNSRGYEPGNVRWATQSDQMRNTRRTIQVTAFGKTQCIPAWAEERGMPAKLIGQRISLGWTAEDALTLPSQGNHLGNSSRSSS